MFAPGQDIGSHKRYLTVFMVTVLVLILVWELHHGELRAQSTLRSQETFKDLFHGGPSNQTLLLSEPSVIKSSILETEFPLFDEEQNTIATQRNATRQINSVQTYPYADQRKLPTLTRELPAFNQSTKQYSLRSTPYRAYWVDFDAPFLDRLKYYNHVISNLRKEIKNKRGFKNWADPDVSPVVLWGSADDFLEQLSNFTDVKTVTLTWLKDGTSTNPKNLLLGQYYQWVGSEPLCTWIRTAGLTKARWDAVYQRKCTTDPKAAENPQTLEPVYLHGKPINPDHYWPNKGLSYPSSFYTTPPPHVLYLHIAEDAIITSVGDVFSGSVKIVPYSCSHDRSPSKPGTYASTPIYAEVFIMSGHWGAAHFHKSVELLPRIAPYLDFLVENPDIMIHVSETGGTTARVLSLFGVSRERLVSEVTRAKIVYMPQGTPCGFAQVQGAQMLAHYYRKHISKHLRDKDNICSGNATQNLVVIHRSGMRRISDSITIEMQLKELAEEYNLNFCLYHDQQLPSFEDTMIMFSRAALVVAPHGAGESNLMFCEPGVFVIEAVCNRPHVNMCYQRLSHILGHRYHGIPSQNGCEGHIEVNPAVVQYVARVYLQQWKALQSL